VLLYKTTWPHNPEDHNKHIYLVCCVVEEPLVISYMDPNVGWLVELGVGEILDAGQKELQKWL
jgi:hypothetical protein